MNRIKELYQKGCDELEGTVLKTHGKKYILTKTPIEHTCMGCAFYDRSCPAEVIPFCTKGFILTPLKAKK